MRNTLRLAHVCVLAMLGAGSMAMAAPVTDRDLRNLWQQGDLPEMQRLAESGDVRAQHWTGLMLHRRGHYDEAIRWYARAVAQGDGKSADRIASFYEHGTGRTKDIKVAMGWYRKGAALGHTNSQIRYASALRSGTVLARNEREAFRWYSMAASQRHAHAHLGYAYLPLAEMYEEGSGVPQDLRRAYALAKAAELTVDDSDIENQRKASSLQADVAARLQPSDVDVAEQLFETLRPDLAERLSRGRTARWAGFALLILIAAVGIILQRKSGRAARKLST